MRLNRTAPALISSNLVNRRVNTPRLTTIPLYQPARRTFTTSTMALHPSQDAAKLICKPSAPSASSTN